MDKFYKKDLLKDKKELAEHLMLLDLGRNDVGKIAKISQAKKLVLTHFVPPQFNERKLINKIKKDFGKKPIVGKDLLTITV